MGDPDSNPDSQVQASILLNPEITQVLEPPWVLHSLPFSLQPLGVLDVSPRAGGELQASPTNRPGPQQAAHATW